MQTENKYSRGKIYKIIAEDSNDIYIGSTCQKYLSSRMTVHRNQMLNKEYNKGKCKSSEVMKNSNAKIVLIENFPCNDKNELKAREQFWIDSYKCSNDDNLLNTKKAIIETKEEYDEMMKQSREKWSQNNKDKIKAYRDSEHYKELTRQRNKRWREANRERKNELNKQYRERHKEELNEKRRIKREQQKNIDV